ncbi:amidase family protein [Brevibacillus fulvus]|uniref:Amidase n=1 Tax=Brevibacillus fulvus TaxID=1125967 RepID=A0A938XW43_9BACL|nr:amidase family protein [Brevibacillus fulvus]MBM7588778.1 amidase [Brevibacillus fulvus]
MNDDWIVEATIEQLQQAMSAGKVTARTLVLTYLQRIAALDKQGPKLNAVLEINPDALHIAEALDLERKQKGIRSPLHGIPILLKDNIDTGDKMHTSAGTLALANSYASADSFVAQQLRKNGAIILGKTNLTEMANFMTVNMPNGYSSRGGQVLNPYGPGVFDVGGSSSGSASAIAANLAVAAIGTETSGSIISPASANSLVGIKPTVGLISRSGIIPIAVSQDTAGPMTRTVRDAAILLSAMTGIDENDPATWTSGDYVQTDYCQYLDPDGLRGARIGIPRSVYYERLNEEQRTIMNAAIEAMRQQGAIIVDPANLPTAAEPWDLHVLLHEFKPALNAYLGKLPDHTKIRSLRDLIQFNLHHPEQTLKYGQTILLDSEATSGTLTDPLYIASRVKDLLLAKEQGIDAAMKEHKLDALLFPNNFGAGIAAKAGYPSITVPAGYTPDGRPVGVTFTGQAYSEPTLLRLAYAFEQATHHRVPPQFS